MVKIAHPTVWFSQNSSPPRLTEGEDFFWGSC